MPEAAAVQYPSDVIPTHVDHDRTARGRRATIQDSVPPVTALGSAKERPGVPRPPSNPCCDIAATFREKGRGTAGVVLAGCPGSIAASGTGRSPVERIGIFDSGADLPPLRGSPNDRSGRQAIFLNRPLGRLFDGTERGKRPTAWTSGNAGIVAPDAEGDPGPNIARIAPSQGLEPERYALLGPECPPRANRLQVTNPTTEESARNPTNLRAQDPHRCTVPKEFDAPGTSRSIREPVRHGTGIHETWHAMPKSSHWEFAIRCNLSHGRDCGAAGRKLRDPCRSRGASRYGVSYWRCRHEEVPSDPGRKESSSPT